MTDGFWSTPRLREDLQFKILPGGPQRYASSTDRPIEYVVVELDSTPLGYLWWVDADDAAGYVRRPDAGDIGGNAGVAWFQEMRKLKERGLTPSHAVAELAAMPDDPARGHVVPGSKKQAPSLTALKQLAKGEKADWRPLHRFDDSTWERFTVPAGDHAGYWDRVLGCVLGGALGDAIGAPVEFLSLPDIITRFGEQGIAEPPTPAEITDDTQMTLFVMDGLLRISSRYRHIENPAAAKTIFGSLYRWLATQMAPGPDDLGKALEEHWLVYPPTMDGWLIQRRWLYARRAPGNARISGLQGGESRTINIRPTPTPRAAAR